MDCRKCIHLKRRGHVSKCDLFENVEVFGEIDNQPIVENCGSWKAKEPEPGEAATVCHWRPIKKIMGKYGPRYILRTDCGRELEYTNGKGLTGEEIWGEVCAGCGRFIEVHYIRGM